MRTRNHDSNAGEAVLATVATTYQLTKQRNMRRRVRNFFTDDQREHSHGEDSSHPECEAFLKSARLIRRHLLSEALLFA